MFNLNNVGSSELTMLNSGKRLTFKGIGIKIYNIKLLKTKSLAQQDF